MKYGEAESGYVYVFLPADVTEGVVYVEMREPSQWTAQRNLCRKVCFGGGAIDEYV